MFSQSSFAEAVLLHHLNTEPGLDDMFADPILRVVMSADRVQPADVRHALEAEQARRAA
jgi:hypothetical protein